MYILIANFSSPTPIADTKGRVVAVLIDHPAEKTEWAEIVRKATLALKNTTKNTEYNAVPDDGNTPNSLRAGLEYGGDRPAPINIHHKSFDNLIEICDLCCPRAFQAIAEWQNDVYCAFAPRLAEHVEYVKYQVLNDDFCLCDNFFGGPFATSEFFFGSSKSPPWLDNCDMLWGWRALCVLGDYDKSREQLILWEEKCIIAMPTCAMILFPSAFMHYSFTAIRPGETQYHFTQYSHAGLFRFVENGFHSDKVFETTAWRKERNTKEKKIGARMATALGMFSQFSDLLPE
ncbi:hypothetical protein C8J57DRAFT_1041480 [Mycena rebaudengoi]|nr:hypothetical protein C8J57DRAFT_1041480 [Mycena rebaudengoi]